jgi:hypothetical protein
VLEAPVLGEARRELGGRLLGVELVELVVVRGDEEPGLELAERGHEHEELGDRGEVELSLDLGQPLGVAEHDRRDGHLDELELVAQDEGEQEVERPGKGVEIEVEVEQGRRAHRPIVAARPAGAAGTRLVAHLGSRRMRDRLTRNLGALAERDFRLLFSATLVTSLGDAISNVALAFAVLEVGGATDLGIVFAVRQGLSALVVVGGGVLSDRLPRNLILVAASLLQGAAQLGTAAAVLSGRATLGLFVALGALYGFGDGLVVPAEVGLVPQTVSPERLQQANALRGLAQSSVNVLGPAVGGLLVVALSPGVALAVDGVSFLVCAFLLARIRLARAPRNRHASFFHELREGWHEFTAHTWLWSTVVLFGIGNVFFMFWTVLGPTIAKAELGGAGAWATILAAGGVGSIVGGLVAIRHRPSRPLVACVLWPLLYAMRLVSLALGSPAWVVAAASFAGGLGISVHLTLWYTVFQREVPESMQSRVSSYDTLGSFVLTPVGLALAGPAAAALGTSGALWLGAAVIVACLLVMLLIPSIWQIRRPEPESAPA